MMRSIRWLATSVLVLCAASAAHAQQALVVSHGGDGPGLVTSLLGTGVLAVVDHLDGLAGTPSEFELNAYDSVLVYTTNAPLFPDDLGDVLAGFADNGGRVVLATFGFSAPFAIEGDVMGTGYAPLQVAGTGSVSSGIEAVSGLESDRLFDGVTVSNIVYFHNANYAQPALDAGATLLAQDTSDPQVPMLARSADGRVVSINIYPDPGQLSSDGVRLFANSLDFVRTPPGVPGASPILLAIALLVFAWPSALRRRGHSVAPARRPAQCRVSATRR